MTELDLNSKTVLELRKIAKELRVPLSAGISKQGIIDRLTLAIAAQKEQPAPQAADGETAADAPAEATADAKPAEDTMPAEEEKPAESTPAPAEPQPQFRQAYAQPRFNSKPAYQAPSYNRQPGPRGSSGMDSPRTQSTRATGFHSRFGPAPQNDYIRDEEPVLRDERPMRDERPPRTDYARPAYNSSRSYHDTPRYPQRQPAYEQRQSSYEQRQPAYEQRQTTYEQRGGYQPRQNYSNDAAPFTVNPTASEIMQAADYPEVTGVLELLPEGYGFLRSRSMVAAPRDVYVATSQVRRFSLRAGDLVTGKMRPLRDGDKYPALLTVSQVNGLAPDHAVARPSFDQMTPVYPTRRIHLETGANQSTDLRLMDLITPIGFGQRGLLQCAPGTGKTRLLTRLANAIRANHPEAEVMLLLFNENPEDVTLVREAVSGTVYASTFDMSPESHLRLADLVLERAERLVEMKQDVVILVDSLTTLIRVISTTAMQNGRAVPGMISPQSLQKAKRLFGAARCLREGGSLTVIAAMNTDSGQKADDSVVGDFRGAANMELVLDQGLSRAGLYPPFDLSRCVTRKADAIMSPEQTEGVKLIRRILGRLPAENALRELISMLDKAATNADLLSRIKVWADSMQG